MRRLTGLLAVLFMLSLTSAAWAESPIPDLKGTWIVKGSGHKVLKPGAPPSELYGAEPGFHEFELPMIIDKQDGFRFSGYRQVDKQVKLPVSGVLGFDNQSVYMAFQNTIVIGKLVSPDRMECIYLVSGKHRSVASREIITRKR